METQDKNYLKILLYFIFGVAGSILAGFIYFGPRMFSMVHPGFQFITIGVVGSLVFIAVLFYKKWVAMLIVLIFALWILIYFKILQLPQIIGNAFWALGTGLTLFGIACLFETRFGKLPFGKFLVVGLAIALAYFLIAFLRIGPFVRPFPVLALAKNALLGFFVGGGLGLGIEVGALISRMLTKAKA